MKTIVAASVETTEAGALHLNLDTKNDEDDSDVVVFHLRIDPSFALDLSRELGKQAIRLCGTKTLGKLNLPVDARTQSVTKDEESER